MYCLRVSQYNIYSVTLFCKNVSIYTSFRVCGWNKCLSYILLAILIKTFYPNWDTFQRSIMDLRSAQFESILCRTVVYRYWTVVNSYDNSSTEHAWVLTSRVWVLLGFNFFFTPLCILRIFMYICVPEGRKFCKRDATTSNQTWRHGMVFVKVHPPQWAHPWEIHESLKGAQALGFDFLDISIGAWGGRGWKY